MNKRIILKIILIMILCIFCTTHTCVSVYKGKGKDKFHPMI
jgi:hypothetical protein